MVFSSATTAIGILLIFTSLVCTQNNERAGFVPSGYEEVTTQASSGGLGAIERCGEGSTKGAKVCVPYYQCDSNTRMIILDGKTDGHGIIEIRFGEEIPCDHYLDICCGIPKGGIPTPIPDVEQPPSEDPNSDPKPVDPKPDDEPKPKPGPDAWTCGIRNDNGIGFTIKGNKDREAQYGEFPWMVAILDPSIKDRPLICGGSLIAPNVVLTGAHCVYKRKPNDLKIRAGEWDTQTDKELYPYQEREVKEIVVHEDFDPKVLFNDVALLILTIPVEESEVIGTICLPPEGHHFDSHNCIATGWGKDKFGAEMAYQAILKKIEIPTVPRTECQDKLRKTRLGKYFILDQSFMCAGGQKGLDTCTGDGGSPLVCPDPNQPNRYVQAGIVAWGIGCGGEIPAVYVNVAQFRNWIDIKIDFYTNGGIDIHT